MKLIFTLLYFHNVYKQTFEIEVYSEYVGVLWTNNLKLIFILLRTINIIS